MEYSSAMNHGRKITFFKLRKMMKNLYQSVIPQCTSRTPRVGRAVRCFRQGFEGLFFVLDSFLLFFISCLVVHLVARFISSWEGLLAGCMLVSGSVGYQKLYESSKKRPTSSGS